MQSGLIVAVVVFHVIYATYRLGEHRGQNKRKHTGIRTSPPFETNPRRLTQHVTPRTAENGFEEVHLHSVNLREIGLGKFDVLRDPRAEAPPTPHRLLHTEGGTTGCDQ